MKIITKKIISIIGLSVSIWLLVRLPAYTDLAIQYLEQNFSPDGQIDIYAKSFLILGYVLFCSCILIYSILILSNTRQRFSHYISVRTSRFFNAIFDLTKAKTFFFSDVSAACTKLNVLIFAVSTIIGFLLILIFLFFGFPQYEGLFEDIFAVITLVAIILLLIAAFRAHRLDVDSVKQKKIRRVLLVISALLFLYLGEEVSWGQHIFYWEATGIFEKYNDQQETNLHNFINPVMPLFYLGFGLTSFVVLFLVWFFPGPRLTMVHKILIPPPSFFVLTFIMTSLSFLGQSELFEALFSLFAFLYGVRIIFIIENCDQKTNFKLYPDSRRIEERMKYMEKNKLNIFAENENQGNK